MDILSEGTRLFDGREVAAGWHFRPPHDVEDSLDPFAGRGDDLSGECCIAQRHVDPLAMCEAKRFS